MNVPKACIDLLGQSRFRIHIGKAKPARKRKSMCAKAQGPVLALSGFFQRKPVSEIGIKVK